MDPPPPGGTAADMIDAERIEVRLDESAGFPRVERGLHEPDDVERDRELFTRVAETHPGLVRTLSVLIGELADVDLEPAVLRTFGERVRRVGDTLVMRADRITIDASSSE
jgi:hypothetical protein